MTPNKYKDVDDAFDEEFSIGKGRKWVHTIEEANEVKQFIQALDAKERETIEEVIEIAEQIIKDERYSGAPHAMNKLIQSIKKIK
jgi:hypothetical protein